MPGVSALGVGSNLDLSGLLDQISTNEQKRLDPLTAQQSSYRAKLTAWGIVQSSLQKMQTAASALAKAGSIVSTAVTSKNTAFTATIDATASAGNYAVEVTQLAQAQSLTSGKFDSKTAPIGDKTGTTRTLTLSQPGQANPMTVTLTDDQTSLTDIRDAINKQEGSVTASIVQADDNSYYLSFTSRDTGEANKMTITVSGDQTLQNKIGYKEGSPTPGGVTEKVPAKDAVLKINDIQITRSSNTVTGAPDGVTLNLTETNEGKPEQLTIAKNTDAIKTAIQNFVDAYNSLQTTIASQTKYTAVKQGSSSQDSSNGDLLGDGTLRAIQSNLRGMLSNAQDGDYGTLASLGITQDVDGKLSTQDPDDKLGQALKNKPASVTQFFVGDGKTTGFGVQANNLLTKMLATDGDVQNAEDGINKSLKKVADDVTTTSASINDVIARYKTQFTQLDTLVNKLNNTGSYLTQQFAAMR